MHISGTQDWGKEQDNTKEVRVYEVTGSLKRAVMYLKDAAHSQNNIYFVVASFFKKKYNSIDLAKRSSDTENEKYKWVVAPFFHCFSQNLQAIAKMSTSCISVVFLQ